MSAIAATYNQTWAKVRTADGFTDIFAILAGVLQGDTLAPFLFIVALNYALRCAIVGKKEELGFTLVKQAGTRTQQVPAKMATDFNFSDDIALVSDTAKRAAKLLHEVEHHCGRIDVQLNAKKTEVMAYNTENTEVSTLDGKKLKVVADFKYLSFPSFRGR